MEGLQIERLCSAFKSPQVIANISALAPDPWPVHSIRGKYVCVDAGMHFSKTVPRFSFLRFESVRWSVACSESGVRGFWYIV